MRLTVARGSEVLMVLEQRAGTTFVKECGLDWMKGVTQRWISQGLGEVIGKEDPIRRHTEPSDPMFLPHLREFLARNFIFDITLG